MIHLLGSSNIIAFLASALLTGVAIASILVYLDVVCKRDSR